MLPLLIASFLLHALVSLPFSLGAKISPNIVLYNGLSNFSFDTALSSPPTHGNASLLLSQQLPLLQLHHQSQKEKVRAGEPVQLVELWLNILVRVL